MLSSTTADYTRWLSWKKLWCHSVCDHRLQRITLNKGSFGIAWALRRIWSGAAAPHIEVYSFLSIKAAMVFVPMCRSSWSLFSLSTSSLYSLLASANKYGPFMHLQLGQVSHIIVSSPEYAKEIMKTHGQIFANRPRTLASDIIAYNSTDILFSPCGNYWRQLPKIGTLEIFSAKRVQSFRRIREEEAIELVRNIAEHEGSFIINLSRKIFTITNSIIARTAFGKKTKNVEHILENMDKSIKMSSGLSICDLYPSLKFISVITGTRARMMKLQKRRQGEDDIIGDHKEKDRNNVGDAEDDLFDDVMFGGTDSTASTADWAMSELLKNPKAMKEAQEEVRRIYGGKGYVDESEIIINAWTIGRDSKDWTDPEKFEPKRILDTMVEYNFKVSNFDYIPFGAGRRICPGSTFATSILELLLSNLLCHFNWKLPNGMKFKELDMDQPFGAAVRRQNDLILVPIGYSP
ncbi:cytochrome P450 71D10-like [Neltuma alba]|uniref:cytochrome P450 71D10-like n=1 Tax=Neltuma alba TaxID=207710 RepID=UPI0010A48271|nr:cytochrome P450 71D10-like [Prosopis alba]